MAVDLADLIDALTTEVNPPGSDLFPDATEDQWVSNLQNSFWEAKLYGFFDDHTESDGLISPLTVGNADLARDQQQLIVLFAGLRVIRNELKNTNTGFRAKAGPVEFETQNSANLLRDVLRDIRSKVDLILANLSDLSSTTTTYIDSLVGRDNSLYYEDTYFYRG